MENDGLGGGRRDCHLSGKVAIVTGGGSGIGASVARRLARLGVTVMLAGRRQDAIASVSSAIVNEGGNAAYAVTDVTNSRDARAMVAATIDRFGALHYAVNSAGAAGRGAFLDIGLDDFDRIMNANVRGTFLSMQAELPAILDSGGGAIVNVASVAGVVGIPGVSAYVASKHAVIGLTRSVALEYATRNVRINAIAPGATDTELLANAPEKIRNMLTAASEMKRIAAPDEIASGIIYLLVDATFSTGSVLSVDGGQTAS